MSVALALLLGTVLVACAAPTVFDRLLWSRIEPQVTLAAWLVLVLAATASLVAAMLLMLLPQHGAARQVVQLVHHCFIALRHGEIPLEEFSGLLGIGFVALAAFRFGKATIRYLRRRRCLHRSHVELFQILTGRRPRRRSTIWLDLPDLMAYSVAGRPGLVVASRGLSAGLAGADLAAVLAHERAHLRGHHHLLVGLAEAVAAAVPWLPLMRRSPVLVRILVELCADRVAARTHGASSVRTALLRMSTFGAPRHALGMGGDCTEVRLNALTTFRPSRGAFTRSLGNGIAGFVAVCVPALSGAALLTFAALAACPVSA